MQCEKSLASKTQYGYILLIQILHSDWKEAEQKSKETISSSQLPLFGVFIHYITDDQEGFITNFTGIYFWNL